jgi:hypothetical protein
LNLMAPVESTRSTQSRYTAQGLGDRIHLLTILLTVSEKLGSPVALHLSADKGTLRKRNSFNEIVELFPSRNFELYFHDFLPSSDEDFRLFLLSLGISAQKFYYQDYPGWREKLTGFEVSRMLKEIQLLRQPSALKDCRYVTSQWDTTGVMRKFTAQEIQEIEDAYTKQGFEVVTVGGAAREPRFRDSLRDISELMSASAFHIGVDSGFMHFAQLFLPPTRIHVYSKPGNYWSHHLFRGLDNGMVLNAHFTKVTPFQLQKVLWRYNSPGLLRLWHTGKTLLSGRD